MSQSRLNCHMILHVHKEFTDNLDLIACQMILWLAINIDSEYLVVSVTMCWTCKVLFFTEGIHQAWCWAFAYLCLTTLPSGPVIYYTAHKRK